MLTQSSLTIPLKLDNIICSFEFFVDNGIDNYFLLNFRFNNCELTARYWQTLDDLFAGVKFTHNDNVDEICCTKTNFYPTLRKMLIDAIKYEDNLLKLELPNH